MKGKALALIISKIFSIRNLTPLILFFPSQMIITQLGWVKIFLLSLLSVYILPVAYYFYALKKGIISDWDISNREERKKFNLITAVFVISGLAFFWLIGERTLVLFYLNLLIPCLLYLIITLFWKISNHALVNSLVVLLIYLYTQKSIILYLGIFWIGIMGWARIKLKAHTLAQVITGALLPLVILL